MTRPSKPAVPTPRIKPYERDILLGMDDPRWPSNSPALEHGWTTGWSTNDALASLWRPVDGGLVEGLVRFPSGPVYGINRERSAIVDLPTSHHFALRMYRREVDAIKPSERIYILFNGLNELDHLGLYWRLAKHLLDDGEHAATVILHPLPGHLNRYPLPSEFGEAPLNRYVGDPGNLFRQYLRCMVETQWLLSALVPLPSYRVVAGADLLAEAHSPNEQSRLSPQVLADSIYKNWARIFAACGSPEKETALSREDIVNSINTIRAIVGWDKQPTNPDEPPPDPKGLSPNIHVVGYSLGAYMAQSVFFTWPFAVASCTAICAGSPLQSIRLEKFAHPHEWDSVMHGLRYELESSMVSQRIAVSAADDPETANVVGIPLHLFASHLRLFYDVFLQDYRSAYGARVSEFVERLLFIVGGGDPIVSVPSVVASAPVEGINMIEVANISHFIGLKQDPEWDSFWLPESTRTIRAFASHAEEHLFKSLTQSWWNAERTRPKTEKQFSPIMPPPPHSGVDVPLNITSYQEELDAISALSGQNGWVFAARNRVPLALWGKLRVHRRGTVPHFEDRRIAAYWWGMEHRAELLETHSRRVTLILPGILADWAVDPNVAIFSAKHDAFAHHLPDQSTLQQLWRDFAERWARTNGALRRFDPNLDLEGSGLMSEIRTGVEMDSYPDHPITNTLPDVWLAFDSSALRDIADLVDDGAVQSLEREVAERSFVEWARKLWAERKVGSAHRRELESYLKNNHIRLVKVSTAEFDRQFMGQRIGKVDTALNLIVHCALAYELSEKTTTPQEWGVGASDSLPEN